MNEVKLFSAERIRDALQSARGQLMGRGTDMRAGFLIAAHAIETLLQEKPDNMALSMEVEGQAIPEGPWQMLLDSMKPGRDIEINIRLTEEREK